MAQKELALRSQLCRKRVLYICANHPKPTASSPLSVCCASTDAVIGPMTVSANIPRMSKPLELASLTEGNSVLKVKRNTRGCFLL